MFDEQVGWALEAGADFIIGETYGFVGEAILATEAIKRTGLPAVVTLAVYQEGLTRDGQSVVDACKRLEAAGADVVGMNCTRGATDDAAAAEGHSQGGQVSRRRATGSVPHHAGATNLPITARSRL